MANFSPFSLSSLDHTLLAIYIPQNLCFHTSDHQQCLSHLQAGINLLLTHLPFLKLTSREVLAASGRPFVLFLVYYLGHYCMYSLQKTWNKELWCRIKWQSGYIFDAHQGTPSAIPTRSMNIQVTEKLAASPNSYNSSQAPGKSLFSTEVRTCSHWSIPASDSGPRRCNL